MRPAEWVRPHIDMEAFVSSLFNDKELDFAWDVVGSPEPTLDLRVPALLRLIDARGRLPGMVFVAVPVDATDEQNPLRPQWQQIIAQTEPYCKCSHRRVIYPSTGRSRFLSSSPPNVVTMTQPSTGSTSASPLIMLAPHGGDQDSALVAWAFNRGELTAAQLPYMADSRANFRLIRSLQLSLDEFKGGWSCKYQSLGQMVVHHGEVIFLHAMPDPCGYQSYDAWLPHCAVTKVEFVAGDDRQVYPQVTFEIDASVDVIAPDPKLPLHRCTNNI